MENLTTSPEQAKNNQASNKQPKKTWVEPAMTILNINSGKFYWSFESNTYAGPNGSDLYLWGNG